MTIIKPKILAILGYPLGHSLSPLMQQAALSYHKLPWYYVPLEVSPPNLPQALKGLRAVENFAGANVTIPHKEAVIPYLDALSPEAQATGAVNTIVVEPGGWKGYNTDIEGFLAPLKRRGFSPGKKSAVILGAGGAARAVLYALIREGAREVTLLCRQPAKAQKMAKDLLGKICRPGVLPITPAIEIHTFEDTLAWAKISQAHLLINATPLGMGTSKPRGKVSPPLPIPFDCIKAKTLVYDLIYNPPLTPLLITARKRGARIINGGAMLVAQGARAFELWTQKPAPRKLMEKTLSNILKKIK